MTRPESGIPASAGYTNENSSNIPRGIADDTEGTDMAATPGPRTLMDRLEDELRRELPARMGASAQPADSADSGTQVTPVQPDAATQECECVGPAFPCAKHETWQVRDIGGGDVRARVERVSDGLYIAEANRKRAHQIVAEHNATLVQPDAERGTVQERAERAIAAVAEKAGIAWPDAAMRELAALIAREFGPDGQQEAR